MEENRTVQVPHEVLKKIDSETLLSQTRSLACEEKRVVLSLIEHLREIERRMLYSELGYGNLFDFCVKHLGLSEGAAYRRIATMRLIRDIPAAKASLETGKISISNAAKLQSVFRAQKVFAKLNREPVLTKEKKKEIIDQVVGLSQRECERRLFELLPAASTRTIDEKERIIAKDKIELRLILSDEMNQKLKRLKELLSHKIPSGSLIEILDHIVSKEIERLEHSKGLIGLISKPKSPRNEMPSEVTSAAVRTEKVRSSNRKIRKTLPSNIRREVWRRARGRCEYPNCDSRYFLEVDHIKPISQGGLDDLQNLRLLCRTHNLQHAKESLGHEIMKHYHFSLG